MTLREQVIAAPISKTIGRMPRRFYEVEITDMPAIMIL
jgi:hypothetical protein